MPVSLNVGMARSCNRAPPVRTGPKIRPTAIASNAATVHRASRRDVILACQELLAWLNSLHTQLRNSRCFQREAERKLYIAQCLAYANVLLIPKPWTQVLLCPCSLPSSLFKLCFRGKVCMPLHEVTTLGVQVQFPPNEGLECSCSWLFYVRFKLLICVMISGLRRPHDLCCSGYNPAECMY